MRTIGVVTVGRSDYSIYLPVLRHIQQDTDLRLHLIVGGMHLSPEFGLTVQSIEEDGIEINERIEMLLSSDTPEGIAKSMGLGTIGFAQAYARSQPDILLLLGDRFEMHAAAVASIPFLIPLAHIAGGAVTMGATDDVLRHSLTKMGHLHFTETEEHARRIIRMGEEPWRVSVTGSPALDNLPNLPFLSCDELGRRYGMPLPQPPLLVTFHPVTLEYQQTESYMSELLAALSRFEVPIVFTYPNADTHGRVIIRMIEDFVTKKNNAQIVPNLGMIGYYSLMRHAIAMVGNSSSGIIEAASFKVPAVNIGSRQTGRVAPKNVINVGCSREEIAAGIYRAVSDDFREQLHDLVNPYGDGHATERIVKVLKTVDLNDRLLKKRFYDTY